MRVAITGAGGRLGRALVAAIRAREAGAEPGDAAPGDAAPGDAGTAPGRAGRGPVVLEAVAWSRPSYDLDDPEAAARCLARDHPDVVLHAAAWTDVDGCAREPHVAMRRNGLAAAELADACARAGVGLVLVSTNEVFDGRRTDGRPYAPTDRSSPANPYGASKLAGESAAQAAYLRHGALVDGTGARAEPRAPASHPASDVPGVPQLGIVRTAWLYGPPGNDFPSKILAAAERARAAGEPLRVVGDEVGSPTYAPDLAAAIVEMVATGSFAGVHHLVNAGVVSRAGWARHVVASDGMEVAIREVPLASWSRPSTPPAWAVLEPGDHDPRLRPWDLAYADYLPILHRARGSAAGATGSPG